MMVVIWRADGAAVWAEQRGVIPARVICWEIAEIAGGMQRKGHVGGTYRREATSERSRARLRRFRQFRQIDET